MTHLRRLLALSCVAAFALAACVSGDDVTPTDAGGDACESPMTVCTLGSQSVCTDTSSDDQNCGLCNTVCPNGTSCAGGACVCDGGQTYCNGKCVDLKSDPKNCGACGNACINKNCTTGECDRVVFLSDSAPHTDLTSGLDPFTAADALCNNDAKQLLAQGQEPLPGTYKAWLATSQGSPATRFTKSTTPYVLPDGTTRVADNWADLTSGTLQHDIDLTPSGISYQPTDPTRRVMTNVAPDGTAATTNMDCTGWSAEDPSIPIVGDPTATTAEWTHMASTPANWDCTLQYRLYCFEQ